MVNWKILRARKIFFTFDEYGDDIAVWNYGLNLSIFNRAIFF